MQALLHPHRPDPAPHTGDTDAETHGKRLPGTDGPTSGKSQAPPGHPRVRPGLGAIPDLDRSIICVGGTGRGADTVCLIKPAPTSEFKNLRVKAILAKPFNF